MARTKGSKGKKTLAKEMGVTLEEYEKYLLMSPENKEKFLNELKNTEESDKINSEIKSELPSEELPTCQDTIYSELKNNLPSEEKAEEIKSVATVTVSKKKTDFPLCDRCHTEIKCDTRKINLTYLTGTSSYHRYISTDQPVLCPQCSLKLSKLIEEFLFDNGNGVPLKYGLTDIKYFEERDE